MADYAVDWLLSFLREKVAEVFKTITGFDEEVKKLTNNLEDIQAVIEDAERRQVQEVTVKKWLQDLKDVSYDIDDLLDDLNTAILKQKIEQEAKASGRPPKKARYAFDDLCSNFSSRRDIASKIGELNGRLDEIAGKRNRYNFKSGKGSREKRIITTSVIDESEVFAKEEDEREIKQMLLRERSAETKNPCIISIVGMGGIGKTTLARLAYNDAEVESKFDERIWVCVSDPFEEERIAVEILESLLCRKPKLVGRDSILKKISNSVFGKKVLLVLDNVWTEDSNDWEQLKASLQTCSPGSRILGTTRKQTVAMSMGSRTMDIFFLSQLPDEKCWSLFSHLAFFDRKIEECKNLEDIGWKIVRKCKGLPLAVKVVGGLLRFRKTKEEWQCILDSEMWEIEEVEKGVFPPLLLSYYDLPPVLKQCFSYCAIFPKDYLIHKDKLIYLWMSQDLLKETKHKKMEVVGEEYFNKLAMLSFFQDFGKYRGDRIHYCKMHDIVHDFAQVLTARECLLMEIDGVESQNKPYFETIRHLTMTGRNENVGISMEDWKKLRTLSINESGGLERILNSIDHLTCLRALDLRLSRWSMMTDKIGKLTRLRYLNLSRNAAEELPHGIGIGMGMAMQINLRQSFHIRCCNRLKESLHGMGKLINLVYLNLSGNADLDILPEAVCDLFSLRSLDISQCRRLKELPHGMGKLINLVYLNLSGNEDLEILPEAVCDLCNLQSLDISGRIGLKELPHGMGKLINLVYLNLSGNVDLENLPKAVFDLCNLQSLDISHCNRLKELSPGMGKLINLVHLENELTCLRFMPKEMERLTRLCTLKEFVASSGGGGGGSCSLEGLGKLAHLQGRLKIKGLGNIAESSEENKAILLAKTGLRQLYLMFDCNIPKAKLGVESPFLEALQPPSCLEDLYIENFQGPPLLPNWMMSLTMLKKVTLSCCANWETFPPLGKLPFLEQLVLQSMERVKNVGEEFLGIERATSSCSYITSSNNCIAFPKLYRLEFWRLPNWKEWEYGKLSTSTSAEGEAASSSSLNIMPCLEKLIIHLCPLLTMLPHLILQNSKIQILDFRGEPIPKQRFNGTF